KVVNLIILATGNELKFRLRLHNVVLFYLGVLKHLTSSSNITPATKKRGLRWTHDRAVRRL
ncbi:hypothetical protein, partial [Oleiphilus sp. HI0061]|uniref:hypothetical protein n=1 Tax=Oleiphilus sp. HI0061 TaxID=1822239 RepID=UPI000B283AF9